MKLSVLLWDASFRESFHTIDNVCNQDYPIEDFELIWIDFYSNSNPNLINKINKYSNAYLLNLENDLDTNWHLGKCLNAGIRRAKGEIAVLPDGDVLFYKDHLKIIESELYNRKEKVVYFRRWDEPEEFHSDQSVSIKHLESHSRLNNPTNYAGCFALHKCVLERIGGYEENDIFAGPGANGMETYLRLRNAGLEIKWHEKKIFHPWHPSSGSSDKITAELIKLAKFNNWLKPYSGIKQSWALRCRERDLSFVANDGTVELYVENAPTLNDLKSRSSRMSRIMQKIWRVISK